MEYKEEKRQDLYNLEIEGVDSPPTTYHMLQCECGWERVTCFQP